MLIHKGINRINPYPPSFNKIAAKIIDPSKGASTWALGNHKWVKNIGIFTKNANKMKIDILIFNKIIEEIIKNWYFIIKIILINKGNEAEIVYIIK